MIGRRAAVGLALVCALAFSAFAASSAMAVNGTTAFTCVKESTVGAGFSDAHCKTAVSSNATFVHKEIAQDLTTTFHGTNEKTTANTLEAEPAILKGKPLGIETEIKCLKVTSHGQLTNRLEPTTKEHWIEGKKVTVHYSECKVEKPANCKIPNNTILVENTEATTKGEAVGEKMNTRFKPEVGTTFVEFEFKECTNGLFNGVHKVEGDVAAQTEGATLVFNHAAITAENKLKFFGAAAGLSGKITLSQAAGTAETEPTGNPISATTVT
jgi:hypothetical protein